MEICVECLIEFVEVLFVFDECYLCEEVECVD